MSSSNLSKNSYKVEKILSTTFKDGEVFYEVKWIGFKKTTIEPETNPDIVQIVQRLWKKRTEGKDQALSSSDESDDDENSSSQNLKSSAQSEVQEPECSAKDRKGLQSHNKKYQPQKTNYCQRKKQMKHKKEQSSIKEIIIEEDSQSYNVSQVEASESNRIEGDQDMSSLIEQSQLYDPRKS